jgi:hypothetical protein
VRDWHAEQERDRRERETFRRIHRLVKRGYRPDWDVQDVEDAISFEHLGQRERQGPTIILDPDGKIVATSLFRAKLRPAAPSDGDRIYNDDSGDGLAFDTWLQTIAQPTWRERSAPDRGRFIWQPLITVAVLGALWLFGAGVSNALSALWQWLFGHST